jgi:hypothetical protein
MSLANFLFIFFLTLSMAYLSEASSDVCKWTGKDGSDLLKAAHFDKMPPEKRGNGFKVLTTNYKGFPQELGDPNDEPEFHSDFTELLAGIIKKTCDSLDKTVERDGFLLHKMDPLQVLEHPTYNHSIENTVIKSLTASLIFFVCTTVILALFILCQYFPHLPFFKFFISAGHFISYNLLRIGRCFMCLCCFFYRCAKPPQEPNQTSASEQQASDYDVENPTIEPQPRRQSPALTSFLQSFFDGSKATPTNSN